MNNYAYMYQLTAPIDSVVATIRRIGDDLKDFGLTFAEREHPALPQIKHFEWVDACGETITLSVDINRQLIVEAGDHSMRASVFARMAAVMQIARVADGLIYDPFWVATPHYIVVLGKDRMNLELMLPLLWAIHRENESPVLIVNDSCETSYVYLADSMTNDDDEVEKIHSWPSPVSITLAQFEEAAALRPYVQVKTLCERGQFNAYGFQEILSLITANGPDSADTI